MPAVAEELCDPQPVALLEPLLLAVTAEAPLAPLQPIAAATAAFFSQAAFIAGVHWAAAAALQPAALFPVLEAAVALVALVAWAEQPPSAATVGACPFTEATTALAVVVDPAVAVLALLWASHAWATVAVQANADRARASSRSDFMDPTSRKVLAAEALARFGERAPSKLYMGTIG
jgi:hypothetical protein